MFHAEKTMFHAKAGFMKKSLIDLKHENND